MSKLTSSEWSTTIIVTVIIVLVSLFVSIIITIPIVLYNNRKRKSKSKIVINKTKANTTPSTSWRPYYPKTLLTYNERYFYQILTTYLNPKEFILCPQVSYSALIDKDKITNTYYKQQFNSYYVDFVICNRNFFPLCAIELDDPSHLRESIIIKDKNKDTLFFNNIITNCSKYANGTFKFFRIPFTTHEDFDLATHSDTNISRDLINLFSYLLIDSSTALPKNCICGASMDIKLNKSDGRLFLGCTNFFTKDKKHITQSLELK